MPCFGIAGRPSGPDTLLAWYDRGAPGPTRLSLASRQAGEAGRVRRQVTGRNFRWGSRDLGGTGPKGVVAVGSDGRIAAAVQSEGAERPDRAVAVNRRADSTPIGTLMR